MMLYMVRIQGKSFVYARCSVLRLFFCGCKFGKRIHIGEVMDLGNPLSACVRSRLLRLCAGVEMNGKVLRIVTWACIDHLRL